MAKRKKYSEEFKREAVALTRQPGASVAQIAQDIGVNANQLHRWRRELRRTGGSRSRALAWPATRKSLRSSVSWRK
jgi:transposase-like protein